MNNHEIARLKVTSIDKLSAAVCALQNSCGGIIDVDFEVGHQGCLNLAVVPKSLVMAEKRSVIVPEGNDKPYSVDGCFYCLKNGEVVKADGDMVMEMLLASKKSPLRWERQFADEVEPENFNQSELKSFVEAIGNPPNCDVEAELSEIGLFRKGRYTNAADVLLSDDVVVRNPQIRIKGVLCGDKTDSKFSDYQVFSGPLLPTFEEVWFFILRNTSKTVGFEDDSPSREVVYQYPPKAVREGLINALAHRDYESYAGGIKIEIYRDSLSIWNVGGFMNGMSPDGVRKGDVSILRNPDISYYLSLRNYMETLGRGGPLILSECAKAGLPEPKWEEWIYFQCSSGRLGQ